MSGNGALATVRSGSLTEEEWGDRRRLFSAAVIKNASPGEVDMVIAVCRELGFDPLLGHVTLIDSKVYVTHKGLWHLAHRSGMLDGIEVLAEGDTDSHYTARVAIYRKDMRYPFAFTGRYPKGGRNKQYGPEMALARAECLALRRAFDVSMPIYEEIYWEGREGERPRSEIREVPRQTPAALPAPTVAGAPADPVAAAPALDFAAWSASLDQQAADGVALKAIAEEVGRVWDRLTDAQAQAVTLRLEQIKAARKAGHAAPAAEPAPRPARPAKQTDEALLARVIDATRPEEARAGAAAKFLDRATDAEGLFSRVAQLTVLDFPRAILDVLVAEQRERLGLPDDEDAGDVIESRTTEDDLADVPF